jgi:sugar/nucleoside kinase (ribokinase family)
LDEHSLTYPLLFSKSFHLICSPTRCINLINAILLKRKTLQPGIEKPLFIWEPVPDLCTPDELLNCTNALPYVDVCSPNQSELAGFLGDQSLGLLPSGEVDKEAVEKACEQLLSSMPLRSYTLVIRCGKSGCYIAKNGGRSKNRSIKRKRPARRKGGLTLDMDMEALFAGLLSPEGDFHREREEDVEVDPGIEKWIPAYFQGEASNEESSSATTDENQTMSESESAKQPTHRVVDPTGGGNGFLGGLSIALARGKTIEEAAAWASVSASLAIEQVGMPVLGTNEAGKETWNGVVVQERLDEFKQRAGLTTPNLDISVIVN